jgi:hypothetical protein
MSTEMIVELLWIEDGKKPNWDAGKKKLQEITSNYKKTGKLPSAMSHLKGRSHKELETYLTHDLDVVKAGVEGHRSDVSHLSFPPWKVYLSGGESYGDDPTVFYSSVCNLNDAGAIEPLGFCGEMPNYKTILEKVLSTNPNILPCLIGLDKHLDNMVEERMKACPTPKKKRKSTSS